VERVGEEVKETLVMVHGYGAGLGFFYRNYEPLTRMPGWKLYSLDMLGMGNSVSQAAPGDPGRRARDGAANLFTVTAPLQGPCQGQEREDLGDGGLVRRRPRGVAHRAQDRQVHPPRPLP